VLRHHPNQDLEVLLVDNSGSPELAAWAESVRSDVVRVLVLEPRGFGAAVNAGLEAAAGEVIVVFDPGTEATGDLATPLLEMLEQPGVGIAAAYGVRGTGTVKHFHDHPGPEGDAVEAGQLLCIVEAMKMENEIHAQHAGTVSRLSVAPGEPVTTGQVICVVEPSL